MKRVLLVLLLFTATVGLQAQNNVTLNGQIDDFSELCTKKTFQMTMSDGITKLEADMYLPILRDCLVVPLEIPNPFGGDPFVANLQVLPRGKQIIIYDTLNGQPNPNPYKLPIILSRTPYNKGEFATEAAAVCLLGNIYVYQDMRGRYKSGGVYLPLISDSWQKGPYHDYTHVLDITDPSDPRNGNKHEDGYDTYKWVIDSLSFTQDITGDGSPETYNPGNGRIAMFGASALGYNQFQAAAARKIDPTQPGLKALFPIVAPAEFFKSTGFTNATFRDRLVTGWLKGQVFTSADDDLIDLDNSIDNNIHTSADWGLPNKFQAANLAINHFSSVKYNGGPAGYYPNSIGRKDMDASRAMINPDGSGNLNGTLSRYTNMEVPAFNLTGWFDIFIDGQIETWAYMRKYLRQDLNNRRLQKIVIGPWAHQTIGSQTSGDRTYPGNVGDIIGFNFDDFGSDGTIPIAPILKSDLISWFRYNLNYGDGEVIGEPKAVIPESQFWQDLPGGIFQVRIPASDVKLRLEELLGLLNGSAGLPGLQVEIRDALGLIPPQTITFDVPAFGNPIIAGVSSDPVPPLSKVDFLDSVPNVRFYVIGPNDDTTVPENQTLGNYWFGSDTFPISNGIEWKKMFLHVNNTLDGQAPTTEEGFNTYVHDPNDPIATIGGNNMIERTPDGLRDSQGQFDHADPRYAPYALNRPGIVAYESKPIDDSLCIIGYPVANIWAKSNPNGLTSGPTDTDFHVRILDVYPDGRQFYVTEGSVTARGRDYVRNLVENPAIDENWPFQGDDIEFSNIEANQIYEYKFKIYPIAYTFGKGHKVKILITSSNFTRYQVNPNLPIEEGEFFRRKPGDGQTYVYNDIPMDPRVAVQRIHISDVHQSWIDLPIYTNAVTSTEDKPTNIKDIMALEVFPNPASDVVNLYVNRNADYAVEVFNLQGIVVKTANLQGNEASLTVADLPAGMYSIRITDIATKKQMTKKLSVVK